MNENPLVSVCMIAYKHEEYISEAIEGVLMQKTDFPIELVIGDDCSPDKTRGICLEYQQKYPEIIRVLSREKNLGMGLNFVDTFEKCRGRYIALCEGDDYWTDPLKLQKQVDVLEREKDVMICFHEALAVNERGQNVPDHPITLSLLKQYKDYYDINDFFDYEWFMATASVVFRKPDKLIFPEFFLNVPAGDICLYYILLKNGGKIKMLTDVMSVYRMHSAGISVSDRFHDLRDKKKKMYEALDEYFDYKHRKGFQKLLSNHYRWLADYYYNIGVKKDCSGEMRKVRKYLIKSFQTNWRNASANGCATLYLKSIAHQFVDSFK